MSTARQPLARQRAPCVAHLLCLTPKIHSHPPVLAPMIACHSMFDLIRPALHRIIFVCSRHRRSAMRLFAAHMGRDGCPQSPRATADAIVAALLLQHHPMIGKVDVAGPGVINVFLAHEFIHARIAAVNTSVISLIKDFIGGQVSPTR